MLGFSGCFASQCYNPLTMQSYQQVSDFIERHQLLNRGDRVVIGVSGGPDSLCLLDSLHHLGYPLICAHLDHGLRPESSDEAAYAKSIAQSYNLPFEIEKQDVTLKAGPGVSLEEAARLARYDFLVRVARKNDVHVIATGHTADDQVETVLMHFLRGTGPSGLRGMLPDTPLDSWVGIPDVQGIRLIRPLLSLNRDQTEGHCQAVGLEPVIDSSNMDHTFFRNRIRHELLPLLETYNPGIRQILLRLARIMTAEVDLLAEMVASDWESVFESLGESALLLRVEPMERKPLALQRALLRSAIKKLQPSARDVSFDTIERGLQFVSDPTRPASRPLFADLMLRDLGEEILLYHADSPVIFDRLPQLIGDAQVEVPIPGEVELAGGWKLTATSESITPGSYQTYLNAQEGDFAVIDESSLSAPLNVRTRVPGDRVQPLGLEGTTKVSDIMINNRIPELARARWPIVVSGDEVVWVAGVRMSHAFRLTEGTSRVIVIRLSPPRED
ncbi:MAG: tRNA lysidine(34) synthetase TilS [Anaerolineales bacterium]|nr:tRNA lysidine(34) synthetase TilS [Anaerolineales bacterium]